jgi:2-polyprenyl-6-methoxyphenol hydroxylase-like FAD-dependent oxidoreductase
MIDVLVAGGGPAGAAAAAAARAQGLEVELVSAPLRRLQPGESLPPGTEAVLNQLFGAGALCWSRHRAAYENRSAWGAAGLDRSDFMLNPLGHGWHVDRRALDASLRQSLRAQRIRVRCATRVVHCSWNGGS